MRSNSASHIVLLKAVATVNRFGSLSIDGYSNGFLKIIIPEHWVVHVTFINRQVLLNNSAMVVTYSELEKGGPFSPVFAGASTANPAQGVSHGIPQHFSFTAQTPGTYALISAVPDGQADSGMWDYFIVSATAKIPQMIIH
jgi:hypothetical protein